MLIYSATLCPLGRGDCFIVQCITVAVITSVHRRVPAVPKSRSNVLYLEPNFHTCTTQNDSCAWAATFVLSRVWMELWQRKQQLCSCKAQWHVKHTRYVIVHMRQHPSSKEHTQHLSISVCVLDIGRSQKTLAIETVHFSSVLEVADFHRCSLVCGLVQTINAR